MTDAVPWVKWRFDRWRTDEGLRMCGLAARGLWADLLAIMHGCEPYGHLAFKGKSPTPKQIASMVGMTTEREVASLLQQLEDAGVFSRSDEGLIFCRRMVRDNQARINGKRFGGQGGNPALIRSVQEGVNGDEPNPLTQGVNPTPYDREEKEKESEKDSDKGSPRIHSSAQNPTRAKACREDPQFAKFYAAYPKHDAPDDALKAWRQVLRAGAKPAEIMAGLARYQFNIDRQFVKLPAGWLRAGCWKAESPLFTAQADPNAGTDTPNWNKF